MTLLDRRLTPARPDLASTSLRGIVEASRFVEGTPMQVTSFAAPLRPQPSADNGLDTEALYGEAVQVFEENEGWAWCQLLRDGYVGYLPAAMLRGAGPAATHRVKVLRSFLYPAANMKLPISGILPMSAEVAVVKVEGDFAVTTDGCIWADHLAPLDQYEGDFVGVAERFLGAPYLWGGKTSLGLDCSGLLQVSLAMAGIAAPRDSDMQAAIGEPVEIKESLRGLQRGDIIFWRGHVGVMSDPNMLVHATGHSMLVVKEPLQEAAARILRVVERPVLAIRRIV